MAALAAAAAASPGLLFPSDRQSDTSHVTLNDVSSSHSPPLLRSSPASFVFEADRLRIGSWARLRTSLGDLACHFDCARESVAYEILEGPHRCKIEFPFSAIEALHVGAPGDSGASSTLTLDISRPPQFYLYARGGDDGWRPCSDITEGQQASVVARHVITADPAKFLGAIARVAESNAHIARALQVNQTTNQSNQSNQTNHGNQSNHGNQTNQSNMVNMLNSSSSSMANQTNISTMVNQASMNQASSGQNQGIRGIMGNQNYAYQGERSASGGAAEARPALVHQALEAVKREKTMKKSAVRIKGKGNFCM